MISSWLNRPSASSLPLCFSQGGQRAAKAKWDVLSGSETAQKEKYFGFVVTAFCMLCVFDAKTYLCVDRNTSTWCRL